MIVGSVAQMWLIYKCKMLISLFSVIHVLMIEAHQATMMLIQVAKILLTIEKFQ